MSKKRNLLAGLICFLFAFVCLVSCVGVTLSPELAAKQQAETDAQEVLSKLVWDDEDRTAIVSSLIFTTQNKNYPGVTISWSSSEEDIIDTNGKVNRPNSDDPRNVLVGEDLLATVVITATVVAEYSWEENGTQSASTEPITKQFTFTVLAKPEGTDTGTIEDVKLRAWNYIYVEQGVDKALVSNSSITYNVLLSGVVTAKLNAEGATKGFMLHDGTDGIYVYGDNTKINVGDSVEVIGGVYSYYGSLQVGSNVSVSKSNVKVTLPEYKEVTPQAWEDQNKGLGDEVIGHLGGDLYKVEGYLTASYNATTKDEFCITDANTGETSWIYYKSYTPEMKAELEAYVGKYVKVTGAGYDRDSRIVKNHLLWDGGIEEATAPVVDDETKANVLLSQISLLATYEEDFDLNPAGVWEVVSGTGIEIAENVAKVTRADVEQTVVLKVTVTVGEATASKKLTVTIKAIVKETPKHAGTKEDPYTVSDAVLVAGGLADTEVTETVYGYGTVKEITDLNLSYGNATFTITDGTKDIIVFRAKYLNGEKFTSEDQLKVGDVVVIVGQLTNYGGKLEFNSGCNIDSFGAVDAPVEGLKEGQAYKFQLVQPKAGKTVYFTGAMNGYYYATSEDINASVDVYVEAVEGGYNLYFLDKTGAKHYMGIVPSGTHVNAVFDSEKTVFTYDATLKTLKVAVNGEDYVFGTRNDNTYTTIGANKVSYDPFYVTFVVAGTDTPEPPVHEHKFVEGKCECGETDPNYVAPETPSNEVIFDFSAGDTSMASSYNAEAAEMTYNGITFGYLQMKANTYNGSSYLMFCKNTDAHLYNKTAFASAIVKVEVTIPSGASPSAGYYLNLYKEATSGNKVSDTKFVGKGASFSIEATAEDGFYYFNLSSDSTTGKNGQVLKIVVTLADGNVVVPPVHEHKFVEGKCECGEVDPDYVAPEVPVVPSEGTKVVFDDLAKRTSIDTEHQTWEENGVKVTVNKNTSSSNINEKYFNPIRVYKSHELVVSREQEFSVVVIEVYYSNGADTYITALAGTTFPEGATMTNVDNVFTLVFVSPVTSFSMVMDNAQVRINSIEVK